MEGNENFALLSFCFFFYIWNLEITQNPNQTVEQGVDFPFFFTMTFTLYYILEWLIK